MSSGLGRRRRWGRINGSINGHSGYEKVDCSRESRLFQGKDCEECGRGNKRGDGLLEGALESGRLDFGEYRKSFKID